MSDWAPIRDEIKARLRLSDIVGRKVLWDRRKSSPSRGEFWACCPFHNEKSASFHVLDREGYYKCFGCGAGGDAINFVMETENRSYREAMEMLAEEAGVDLPKPSAQERERAEKRASLHEVLERACAFFEESLRLGQGQAARDYLKLRGLPKEIWKAFRLGYWPDGGHALIDHLKAGGVEIAQMRAGGLLAHREDEARDLMRHRLVFAITDGRGRVIGFGGRALREDQQPKYLNSPDTELFHKGRVLYNFAKARARVANPNPPPRAGEVARGAGGGHSEAPPPSLRDTSPVNGGGKKGDQPLIVAEGYMDVIALARAGLRAVAPLGTALTEDQLALLWSVEPAPIICFDGDAAGLSAANRALDRALPLLKPGCTLRFAFLPPGQDPDDLIKAEGSSAMREVLEGARPLFDAYWDFTVQRCDLSTPDGRAQAEAELREGIRRIADLNVRRHYEAFVRARISAWFTPGRSRKPDVRNQKPEFGGPSSDFRFQTSAPRPTAELRARRGRGPAAASARLTEEAFVLSLLTHPEAAAELIEEIGAVHLSAGPLEALQREIVALITRRGITEPEALLAALDTAGQSREARRLAMRQGLRCMPSANPAAEPEAVTAGLKELIAGFAARAEASEVKGALAAALEEGLSEEAWEKARALHVAAQRHSPKS